MQDDYTFEYLEKLRGSKLRTFFARATCFFIGHKYNSGCSGSWGGNGRKRKHGTVYECVRCVNSTIFKEGKYETK